MTSHEKTENTENGSEAEELEITVVDGEGLDMASEKPAGKSVDLNIAKLSALEKEIEKLQKEKAYLMADFDNYRKNAIKERSELIKYSGERLATELLNVLDNFERALSAEMKAETANSFREGIGLIMNELRATMERFDIRELPAEGKPFDPHIHEALTTEITDEIPPGNVVRVFRKAYKFHDRVIRHAQVVVAAGPE